MKNIDTFLNRHKRKVMLIIFPHPDDETVMTGGLIQRVNRLGWRVTVACLTHGERGQMHIHGLGRSIGDIRRQELALAMGRLGAMGLKHYDFPDGYLNSCERWQKAVAELLDEVQPAVVVTYDHSGITGHPDHIALSLELFKQLKKRQKTRLWWVSLNENLRNKLLPGELKEVLQKPEFKVGLTFGESVRKSWAMLAHSSQGLWKKGKLWGWFWVYRAEYFSEADFSRKYMHKYIDFRI